MSKFDKYMETYLKLTEEFKNLDNVTIQELLKSWEVSFKNIEGFLVSKNVTKSQMVSGLEQGLREIPDIISDTPSPIKELALSKYYQVISKTIPEFS